MNEIRRLLSAPARMFLFAALVLTVFCDAARAGAEKDFFDARKADAAGLSLRVGIDESEGWPRLKIDTPIDTGRHISSDQGFAFHASRFVAPIDFGMFFPSAGKNPRMLDSARDASGVEILIGYQYAADAKKGLSLDGDDETGPAIGIIASRLWPGMFIKCSSDFTLFAGSAAIGTPEAVRSHGGTGSGRQLLGPKIPVWYATRAGGETIVKNGNSLADMPVDHLGEGWLLAWYGESSFFHAVDRTDFRQFSTPHDRSGGWNSVAYMADCPMLILFDEAPDSLENIADYGLEVGSIVGVKMVILPLMGDYLPRAAVTEQWAKGLPEEIAEQCDFWAAHSSGFPVGVSETCAWDEKSGDITVEFTFDYEEFRETGGRAAPVSPVYATAWLEGMKMDFSVKPYDPRMMTSAGSWLAVPGVESYTITFPSLARYAELRPAPAKAAAAPERLRKTLELEVEKILEAGPLAPWMRQLKNTWLGNFLSSTQWLVHAAPGETLYFLAEAQPFLNPDLQARTLEYMRRERATRPPETAGLLDGSDGTRRERYEHSPAFLVPAGTGGRSTINAGRAGNFYAHYKLTPPEAIYQLARFYECAGAAGLAGAWDGIIAIREPYLNRLDWATGAPYQWPGQYVISQYMSSKKKNITDQWCGAGGVVDANNMFAASVGQARLARMLGDREKISAAYGLLARDAARRFTLGKMAGHLQRRGVLKPASPAARPEDDLRIPHIVDEYGMTLMVKPSYDWYGGLIYCRDMVPELGRFLRDNLRDETARYQEEFERNIPDWHYAWANATMHAESNCPWPQDAYQTFIARAWIFDAPSEWLERHIDLPWTARGDLYFLHKVAETIRAYADGGGD